MTAVTAPHVNRTLAVTRLHFVNTWAIFGLPAMIMGIIFAANLAIWALIWANTAPADRVDVAEGLQWSGAASYIFVYMAIVAIQAVAVTFPFALGYGVTRRNFFLGTSLSFVILSAIYSTVVAILGWLETATNGWGFGGRMFTAVYFGGENPWSRYLVYFSFMLFFFFVGAMFGTVFVRWKGTGITITFVLLGLLGIGLVALITLLGAWEVTYLAFDAMGDLGRVGVLVLIAVLAALVSFLVIRKATPRP